MALQSHNGLTHIVQVNGSLRFMSRFRMEHGLVYHQNPHWTALITELNKTRDPFFRSIFPLQVRYDRGNQYFTLLWTDLSKFIVYKSSGRKSITICLEVCQGRDVFRSIRIRMWSIMECWSPNNSAYWLVWAVLNVNVVLSPVLT